jgi:hypothetical protein
MALKSFDQTRKELEKLIAKHQLKPELKLQNPYIASGPDYEILAIGKPNGLYDIQLLNKAQVEKSLANTIRIFRDYARTGK